MPDVWIALAEVAPLDPEAYSFAVAYVNVVATVDDRLELVAAAREVLAEEGFELIELEDAEPARERFERAGVSPEVFSLALDAALFDEPQLGTVHPSERVTPEPPPSGSLLRATLDEALEQRTLVRIRSRYEGVGVEGYVVGVGERWLLVHALDSAVSLDGFAALPVDSVAEIGAVDPEDSFVPRFLALSGVHPAPAPDVSLDATRDLLRTAQARFALLSIHIEEQQPGACYIGRLQSLDEAAALVETVDPAGSWDDVDEFDYPTITRIEFGGRYEEALAETAGVEPFTL